MLDGTDKAIIPGFINTHTHASMTLFRGYGDDLPLMTWLEDYIWPVEAQMTPHDVYVGAKLACLEMLRSGTTCFLDMYMLPLETAKAVEEMGLRAHLSYTLFDPRQPRACCTGSQAHAMSIWSASASSATASPSPSAHTPSIR